MAAAREEEKGGARTHRCRPQPPLERSAAVLSAARLRADSRERPGWLAALLRMRPKERGVLWVT